MPESEISAIVSSRFVRKAHRYLVRLAFQGEKAREYWMTERQLGYLSEAFEQTPHGYSTAKIWVLGTFDNGGHYLRCRVERAPWQPPPQYDLSDLEDRDEPQN